MYTNCPIVTPLKCRRIAMRETVNPGCWAFMKTLRENHKGRQIYDINPYAEVYPIRPNTYAILNESLDGMGDVWLYLIVGSQKAMLIDTGFGLGDLKGLCNQISGGKELVVVNTHPHLDHVFGNSQFDRVYCHEYAVPTLEKLNTPTMWDHLFDENGKPIWSEFDRQDLIPYRQYEIIGVPDGYLFDLGDGQLVELIFTAGHSSGHCMFLDKKQRLLFAGDDAIAMRVGIHGGKPDDPYAHFATVTAYRDQMEKLAQRINEFDSVFPGHFTFDLDNFVILDLLAAANAIVANPDDYDYAEIAHTKSQGTVQRFQKFVRGLGTIGYTKKSV